MLITPNKLNTTNTRIITTTRVIMLFVFIHRPPSENALPVLTQPRERRGRSLQQSSKQQYRDYDQNDHHEYGYKPTPHILTSPAKLPFTG